MANIQSARKRARQNVKRRAHNVALKSRMRTHVKNVLKTIASGNKEQAVEGYKKAVPEIDKAANKGLIKANKAARHKSRLNARIRAM